MCKKLKWSIPACGHKRENIYHTEFFPHLDPLHPNRQPTWPHLSNKCQNKISYERKIDDGYQDGDTDEKTLSLPSRTEIGKLLVQKEQMINGVDSTHLCSCRRVYKMNRYDCVPTKMYWQKCGKSFMTLETFNSTMSNIRFLNFSSGGRLILLDR